MDNWRCCLYFRSQSRSIQYGKRHIHRIPQPIPNKSRVTVVLLLTNALLCVSGQKRSNRSHRLKCRRRNDGFVPYPYPHSSSRQQQLLTWVGVRNRERKRKCRCHFLHASTTACHKQSFTGCLKLKQKKKERKTDNVRYIFGDYFVHLPQKCGSVLLAHGCEETLWSCLILYRYLKWYFVLVTNTQCHYILCEAQKER